MTAKPDAQKEINVTKIGQTSHYIYQSTTNLLTTKSYRDQWSLAEIIGPARNLTPIAYYSNEENDQKGRALFCLDDQNTLQDYTYDYEDGEWVKGELRDLNISAHPNTKLCVAYHQSKLHLYFQTQSGEIQEATQQRPGKHWELTRSVLVSGSAIGSAICILRSSGDEIRVFYVHQDDSSIHQTISKNGEWKDTKIENTGDVVCEAFLDATPNPNGGSYTLRFLNKNAELIEVVGEHGDQRAKVGEITETGETKLEASGKSEECFFMLPFLFLNINLSCQCHCCGGVTWSRPGCRPASKLCGCGSGGREKEHRPPKLPWEEPR